MTPFRWLAAARPLAPPAGAAALAALLSGCAPGPETGGRSAGGMSAAAPAARGAQASDLAPYLAEFAQRQPDAAQRLTLTGRLRHGSAARHGLGYLDGHYSTRAGEGDAPVVDMIAQIDLSGPAPLYRIALRPVSMSAEALSRAVAGAQLRLNPRRGWKPVKDPAEGARLEAALPPATLRDGALVGAWTYCGGRCAEGLARDMRDRMERDAAFMDWLRALRRTGGEVIAERPGGGLVPGGGARPAHLALQLDPPDLAPSGDRLARGWTQAAAARAEHGEAFAGAGMRLAESAGADAAYEDFAEGVEARTLLGAIEARCGARPAYRRSELHQGGAQAIARRARALGGWMRCAERTETDYDYAAWGEALPGLAQREAALWEETAGATRRAPPSSEQMVEAAGRELRLAARLERRADGFVEARLREQAAALRSEAMWEDALRRGARRAQVSYDRRMAAVPGIAPRGGPGRGPGRGPGSGSRSAGTPAPSGPALSMCANGGGTLRGPAGFEHIEIAYDSCGGLSRERARQALDQRVARARRERDATAAAAARAREAQAELDAARRETERRGSDCDPEAPICTR